MSELTPQQNFYITEYLANNDNFYDANYFMHQAEDMIKEFKLNDHQTEAFCKLLNEVAESSYEFGYDESDNDDYDD